jgi:hypothetical protein
MSLLTEIGEKGLAQAAAAQQQYLDPVRQYILDHFGQNGLYAAYFVAGVIVLAVVYRLIKLSFELVFFLAIPSVLSAFVLTYVLPYSFFYLLPATTALFTLGLVIRMVGFSRK